MLHRNDSVCVHSIEATRIAGCLSRSPQVGTPCPELAGLKTRITGTTPIYVIDRSGYRRLVPFPLTFINLFSDSILFKSVMVSEDVADIPEGPPLDDRAILVRGVSSELIYLIDRGTKKLISSSRIMDKYGFDERCVVSVPQVVIDSIRAGEVWE
jgi:hypothetical protein